MILNRGCGKFKFLGNFIKTLSKSSYIFSPVIKERTFLFFQYPNESRTFYNNVINFFCLNWNWSVLKLKKLVELEFESNQTIQNGVFIEL